MLRSIAIALLLILFSLASYGQQIYSATNLKKASQEDLEIYLGESQKLKKTGTVLAITGSLSAVTGILIAAGAWKNEWGETIGAIGIITFLGGTSATLVGLPIIFTASSRIKRINQIKAGTYSGVVLDLMPCTHYNLITQNYQPGITLRIRF